MSRALVLKFGGTSLATAPRIRLAARRVAAHVRRGRDVVVVVSAAGRETDRIFTRALRVADAARADVHVHGTKAPTARAPDITPDLARDLGRELDRALATGEDRSAALLAVALLRRGVRTRSLRGGEAGVRAAGDHGDGGIVGVDTAGLRRLLLAGVVPVVSGFQGCGADGETITLGRGGSDTSAVAVAAALGAACDIVTDVKAVYDRDPRVHPDARPLPHLTHDELLALADAGARVVHPDAARLARDACVPLRVHHYRAPLRAGGTRITPDVHATHDVATCAVPAAPPQVQFAGGAS